MAPTGLGFGVDVGGSGIKAAPVDLAAGAFTAERVRLDTPRPATPAAVTAAVTDLLGDWSGPFGMALPAVVERGVARTAANIDPSWIGTDVAALILQATGQRATVVNDADAAGVAEATYGAAVGRSGLVLALTLGTGIGSALLLDGELIANSELGHLEIDGHVAEHRASDAARKRQELSWADWAARLTTYLRHVHLLLRPELIVLGGGVSRKADRWLHLLDVDVECVPAGLLNDAGIIGAALLAQRAES